MDGDKWISSMLMRNIYYGWKWMCIDEIHPWWRWRWWFGHNQLAIMFEDVIHDNRSTNVFSIFVLNKDGVEEKSILFKLPVLRCYL
jgi:hypothetical protein